MTPPGGLSILAHMRWSLCAISLFTACVHQSALPPHGVTADDALTIHTLHQEVAQGPVRARVLEAEWELVQAIERAGLLNLAFLYATPLTRAPTHPHHLDGLETLARLQALRQDDFLIPSLFNAYFEKPNPAVIRRGRGSRRRAGSWINAELVCPLPETESL